MTKKEFHEKLKTIPSVKPDEIDLQMMAEVRAEYDPDDQGIPLADVIKEREESGKILLRVPRDLKQDLHNEANRQGVSVNQLCLYMLAKGIPQRDI